VDEVSNLIAIRADRFQDLKNLGSRTSAENVITQLLDAGPVEEVSVCGF